MRCRAARGPVCRDRVSIPTRYKTNSAGKRCDHVSTHLPHDGQVPQIIPRSFLLLRGLAGVRPGWQRAPMRQHTYLRWAVPHNAGLIHPCARDFGRGWTANPPSGRGSGLTAGAAPGSRCHVVETRCPSQRIAAAPRRGVRQSIARSVFGWNHRSVLFPAGRWSDPASPWSPWPRGL